MAEARNRERGLKAALSNPRVSEEAKQHDRDLLASEFGEHIEAPHPEGHATRRASASKKSASTGPHSHNAEEKHLPSTAAPTTQTTRKARRASSGDTGGLQQMSEEKDRGNV